MTPLSFSIRFFPVIALLCAGLPAVGEDVDWGNLGRREKAAYHAPIYFLHPDDPVAPMRVEDMAGELALTYPDLDARFPGPRRSCVIATAQELTNFDQLSKPKWWEKRKNRLQAPRCHEDLLEAAGEEIDAVASRLEETAKWRLKQTEGTKLERDAWRIETSFTFDIPGIDLYELLYAGQPQPDTPHGLWRPVAERLGDTWSTLECYAHVAEGVQLPNARNAPVGGTYDILYYFLFYPFNLSTNVHEGDWDAAIAVLRPENPRKDRPVIIAFFSHESSIFLQLESAANWNLAESSERYLGWVRDGENTWRKRYLHALDDRHPLVFVAHGSHAAYPVPGLTLNGVEVGISVIRELRVPFSLDAHPARVALLPVDSGTGWAEREAQLLPVLEGTPAGRGGLTNLAQGLENQSCPLTLIDVDSPAWARFTLGWGEALHLRGWSGPGGFLHSERVVESGSRPRLDGWLRQGIHPLDSVEHHGIVGRLRHLPSARVLDVYPPPK